MKKRAILETNGDTKTPKLISMILRLTPEQHAWVKEVAEGAHQSQPHVINYVLDQTIKASTTDYIDEIGKIHKAKLRDELLAKQQELKEQLHKLDQDLN